MNKTLRITFAILGLVVALVLLGIFFGRFGNMAGYWPGSMMGFAQGTTNSVPFSMMEGRMMHGIGPGMMMGGGMTAFGWPGMILGWLVNISLIIGAVLLGVWLVRRVSLPGLTPTISSGGQGGFSTPREILQTRYARCEITREQYLEMLGDLS